MRFTLKGTQLEITPSLENYLSKKITLPLKKRLDSFQKEDAVMIDIELSRDTKHHKKGEVFRAEATITIPPHHLLRSETKAEDIRSAIDLLENSITRKLELYKGKTKMSVRRQARKNKNSFFFNEKNIEN